jgi:hypothetical protein
MMLPPSASASLLLHDNAQDCLRDYAGKRAYGLMLGECFDTHFAAKGWLLLERVGDYVLTMHEPQVAVSASSDLVNLDQ